MSGVVVLLLIVCGCGVLLAWASRRWPANADSLVDAIDALLPQTQCAQCGYPGCRPYAQAIAQGAPVNLCPPGGASVHRALSKLLGAEGSAAPQATPLQTVRIDESQCIGCFLCVEACPVDAIIGAPHYLHTVLQDQCTGCELCIDPCPVDCITLLPASTVQPAPMVERRRWPLRPSQPCIRCGECQAACPVELAPQQMLWFGDDATAELDLCIECGLCNQVCPSNIDLVGGFKSARRRLAGQREDHERAAAAKTRFDQRQDRRRHQQGQRELRRKERLAGRGNRQWQP